MNQSNKHLWELSYDEAVEFVLGWMERSDEANLRRVMGNAVQVALLNRSEKTARTLLRQIMLNDVPERGEGK